MRKLGVPEKSDERILVSGKKLFMWMWIFLEWNGMGIGRGSPGKMALLRYVV